MARHGRSRWALFVRRGAMMPEPAMRSNLEGPRGPATLHYASWVACLPNRQDRQVDPSRRSTRGVESRCDAVALGSSISVAAPFVRRCLTGSTMAPFSHPAHRTGQADLSGSSAIAGFLPTEPTVRRYRSGLFRKDLRRVDHRRHAWWITGSGRG